VLGAIQIVLATHRQLVPPPTPNLEAASFDQNFGFTLAGAGIQANPGLFTLNTNGATGTNTGKAFGTILAAAPGFITIAESALPTGWSAISAPGTTGLHIQCLKGATPVTYTAGTGVQLTDGSTIVCTLHYLADLGSIDIIIQTFNNVGTKILYNNAFTFEVSGSELVSVAGTFDLNTINTATGGDRRTDLDTPPGVTYLVTNTNEGANWQLLTSGTLASTCVPSVIAGSTVNIAGWSGTTGPSNTNIAVKPGQTWTCTYNFKYLVNPNVNVVLSANPGTVPEPGAKVEFTAVLTPNEDFLVDSWSDSCVTGQSQSCGAAGPGSLPFCNFATSPAFICRDASNAVVNIIFGTTIFAKNQAITCKFSGWVCGDEDPTGYLNTFTITGDIIGFNNQAYSNPAPGLSVPITDVLPAMTGSVSWAWDCGVTSGTNLLLSVVVTDTLTCTTEVATDNVQIAQNAWTLNGQSCNPSGTTFFNQGTTLTCQKPKTLTSSAGTVVTSAVVTESTSDAGWSRTGSHTLSVPALPTNPSSSGGTSINFN
jgi:hypothetical protein